MLTAPIAVIGAGPAGTAAAIQCARLGWKPLLLERTGRVGGLVRNAFEMENYLGHPPTDGATFTDEMEAHLQRFGVPVTEGALIGLERGPRDFVLETSTGTARCGAVIVAVGTLPRSLEIAGAGELEGAGLFYEVAGLLNAPLSSAVVIGGGEAALDYSLSLARLGARVQLVVRASDYRARGRLVRMVGGESRIETVFGAAPEAIARTGNDLELQCHMGTERCTLRGDVVVAAVGRRSALSLLSSSLDLGDTCGVSTGVPGLYLVGDARNGTLGQVGMAVGDGLDAAMRAARFVENEDYAAC